MEKFIFKNIQTGQIVLSTYPRKDISEPLEGKSSNLIQIYKIIDKIPTYDTNKQRIINKNNYIFTEEINEYSHIKNAYVEYEITDISNEEIIERLNISLGTYLDEVYPLWERAKHAGEGSYILWNKTESDLTTEELTRKSYIDNMYNWITRCRKERDEREKNLIENNEFPSFEWEPRPQQ